MMTPNEAKADHEFKRIVLKVISVKLARKLKQAGARQESQEWWCEEADEGHKLYAYSTASIRMVNLPDLEQWSAFDCPELLERLPETVLHRTGIGRYWAEEHKTSLVSEVYDSPAEALGNLKLLRLENGHTDISMRM